MPEKTTACRQVLVNTETNDLTLESKIICSNHGVKFCRLTFICRSRHVIVHFHHLCHVWFVSSSHRHPGLFSYSYVKFFRCHHPALISNYRDACFHRCCFAGFTSGWWCSYWCQGFHLVSHWIHQLLYLIDQ